MKKTVIYSILLFLGLLANHANFEIYFGVNFLFGSIFSLIILNLFGITAAVIAAVIISSYTFILWGHPYAIGIFGCEILIVGIVSKRFKNIDYITADLIFWLVAGIPLVFLFYVGQLDLSLQVATLIASKQTLNGISNAIFAVLLISIFTVLYPEKIPKFSTQSLAYGSIIRLFVSAFTAFPLIFILSVTNQQEFNHIKGEIKSGTSAAHTINSSRLTESINRRKEAARVLVGISMNRNNRLDESLIKNYLAEADNGGISDGLAILVNNKVFMFGDEGFSELFKANRLDEPGRLSALFANAKFLNYLDHENETLYYATATDPELGVQIFIPIGDANFRAMLDKVKNDQQINLHAGGNHTVLKNDNMMVDPDNYRLVDDFLHPLEFKGSILSMWKNSYSVKEEQFHDNDKLTLSIYVPVVQAIEELEENNINRMIITVVTMTIAIILSMGIAQLLARPVRGLTNNIIQLQASQGANLPLVADKIIWPKTSVSELTTLIDGIRQLLNTISSDQKKLSLLHETAEASAIVAKTTARELSQLIDSANAPIFGVDTQGHINEWNKMAAEITGFDREFAIGKDLLSEFITEDYRESVSKVLNNAIIGQETANFEFPLYSINGKEIMVLLNATARYDIVGGIIGVIGIGQDITELAAYRQQMESRVKERTRQLDAILTLSPDGFILLDENEIIAYANPAVTDLLGFSNDTMHAMTSSEFLLRLRNICDKKLSPNIMSIANEEFSMQLHLTVPSSKVISYSMKNMTDETGNYYGKVLFFRDITHENEVNRMKSEFLTTAAHELRTPLASILGFSELLIMRDYGKEQTKDLMTTIHRQSVALKNLLDELLDLARIEARAGKDFNIVQGCIKDLLARACIEIEGYSEGRTVTQNFCHEWPDLMIDRDKIHQVLINVLSNAFKYSPQGGEVKLSTETCTRNNQQMFAVTISDEGIGLTPNDVKRIGERFFRADKSQNIPGTGLGMAIVSDIMTIHQGLLEVESVLGVGTSMSLLFPVVEDT